MKLEWLGDSALIIRDLGQSAVIAAEKLRQLDCVTECVPSADTVALWFTTLPPTEADIQRHLTKPDLAHIPTRHKIPVCYSLGLDNDEVAGLRSLDVESVADYHAKALFTCVAVGFMPGFAYLEGLPPQLASLPRRAEPRVRVPKGAVGITGTKTGIYPTQCPGGWWIIGRCPLELVHVEEKYFPIHTGDEVSFFAIDRHEFDEMRGERL